MRHPKYRTVKFLIEGGQIKEIREIFNHIPKTVILQDFKVNFGRFNAALADPSNFRIRELQALAKLFDVDAQLIFEMAYRESLALARTRKSKAPPKKKTHSKQLQ